MVNKYLEIYKRIGFNLKQERKKAKLTQGQLAEKTAKLDASKISDIENGKEDFMFSTLLEIANGLGIDIEKLTKGERTNKTK
ncbi:helix-turn-helix transcriptional regulator [Sphingobacterium sp. DN00404]|uniref:Helix-turn-helix transcriptional regulator n=1 Tax=Sphingobacterium micropteri TaxID=2763501 RepID=A0ABR7YR19_9SPHI|nr:helix-turn-helix transcriptional regulator [Sphingobacterium micropteri]MBD1433766.1 helix-turn-helix transcriptional regulator [Sphingobacterium micropteri]